jgi:hypothetical protein
VEINGQNDGGKVINNKMIDYLSLIVKPNDVASSSTP